ncbi:cytochrome c oxidase subunit II transmembrane domain-containing protein [endosymbiont of Tevnia jerichonana]|uniref:cytochrome c oxidase subunit II transmembrane domain-containing protein n=1 Tax=endosymbiont of Tevnia jerichonana TaxID=94785 RepID=UPI000A041F2F
MFQDAASPIIIQLVALHDHALTIIIIVVSLVLYMLYRTLTNKFTCRTLLEAQEIETI